MKNELRSRIIQLGVLKKAEIMMRTVNCELDTADREPGNSRSLHSSVPLDEADNPLPGREAGVGLPCHERDPLRPRLTKDRTEGDLRCGRDDEHAMGEAAELGSPGGLLCTS